MNEKKEEKEKRTERTIIYLTPTEKKDAREKAKKSKLSVSGYFRFRGLSDFAIAKERSIERIRGIPTKEDPLMSEMKVGFSQVINEIKKGFKENRKFLTPIPPLEKVEIFKEKQKRMKEISNLI